jgi:hypothetical protein
MVLIVQLVTPKYLPLAELSRPRMGLQEIQEHQEAQEEVEQGIVEILVEPWEGTEPQVLHSQEDPEVVV